MTDRPTVTVDIETIPLVASLSATYPEQDRPVPANYKIPESIAKWRGEDTLKWAEGRAKECSLNPRLGRVLCIGHQWDNTPGADVTYAETETDEKACLANFWAGLSVQEESPMIVTWNGSWDLRFIIIRSIAHGVDIPFPPSTIRGWFKRYTFDGHFDCKMALLNWPTGHPSGEGLDEWLAFFNLSGKTRKGSEVYPLFLDGKHDDIRTYCAGDVEGTHAIYSRIKEYFNG